MSGDDESTTGGRHQGREVALQVLYAIDLGKPRDRSRASAGWPDSEEPAFPGSAVELPVADSEAGTDGVFDRVTEHFVVPRSSVEFARELVSGVTARCEDLDGLLGIHARNWRVSRMAVVDRNVLRLAVYELRDTLTPVAVVIDEAVDLARRFGSDSSPSFVNGVLDAIARELRAA